MSYNINFTCSFLIYKPFTSYSCLLDISRPSSTLLNRNGDTGHPCLVLGGKAFSLSPLSVVFPMGFLRIVFLV